MKPIRWLVAGSLGIALTLSGCAIPNPSVAAQVGSVSVPESKVDEVNRAFASAMQVSPAETRSRVLAVLVQGEIVSEIARRRQVLLSPALREPIIATDPIMLLLAKDPLAAELSEDTADLRIVVGKLGVEALLSEAALLNVVINPKYGTWVPEQLNVTGGGGSISKPFAAATPAA
ncbi:MAG: hypothetical protein WAS07_08580 [Micropruina sp.]